ncbi:MAG: tRNA preQ1(34) S-adenosylmethionine ribosyltransferase-isomerase QueA [Nitrospirae bacterium]|nr:tRNA preQ1(34) S-adenosylmethionine ribosyltransferase-isomerase QueA [Nitrospirota bacterium]
MRTADFDFNLPKEFIASRPSERRDNSRLLVLHRDGLVEHRRFFHITEYLNDGDMLLLNNTKVFPARITGVTPSGKKIDILLVKETNNKGTWEILCKGKVNGAVTVFDDMKAEISVSDSRQRRFLKFQDIEASALNEMLWSHGYMPLPPYISRKPDDEDKDRYQTVYAEKQGSIAAPTAGLHFTNELLTRLSEKGVLVRTLTLHVGTGTFKPVKAEFIGEHNMDSEYFEIKSSLIDEIKSLKKRNNRLVAAGTTATRALEGFMSGVFKKSDSANGSVQGYTDIFIYPGYSFKTVDSLITNFHLPRSTPLMLVSAFSGFGKVIKAYESAIAMDYRFFSYGDAMLIL